MNYPYFFVHTTKFSRGDGVFDLNIDLVAIGKNDRF
jgi:hypothetical protein